MVRFIVVVDEWWNFKSYIYGNVKLMREDMCFYVVALEA